MALQKPGKYVDSYLYSLNSIIIVANYNVNGTGKFVGALIKGKLYLEGLKQKLAKIKKIVKEFKEVANVHLHENGIALRTGSYPLADIVLSYYSVLFASC